MSYLILFRSHHGSTKKVVGLLAAQLGTGNTTVVDLGPEPAPALDKFDTVLIGGSIHIGRIQKEITHFCQEQEAVLLKKRLGLFLCFMDKEHGQAEFDAAFPEPLRRHATACGLFGGELLLEEMNFLERIMIKKMRGIKSSVSELDLGAISQFTAKLLMKAPA